MSLFRTEQRSRALRAAVLGTALSLGTAALVSAQAPAQATEVKPRIEIAAGPAGQTLKQFVAQTGLQLLFDFDAVNRLTTRPVSGELDAAEALTRMLAGTGLAFEFVNERTVTVTLQGAAPTGASGAAKSSHAVDLERVSSQLSGEQLRLAQVQQSGDAGQQRTSGGAAQQEEKSAQSVQEVIVTATRREERLQDVPLSIAVVTADEISRRGLVNSEDYLRGLPGVNQAEAVPSGQAIIIRGLETTVFAQNYFAGPTTATYFGETPTTSSAGLNASNVDLKLVDIERVEVLRGPQGTAFGSSSMGGAVRTIPVAPKLDRFEGRVGADYSVTGGTGGENYMFQAIGNIPLIKDKLALRGTAYRFETSGFYKNRAGSDQTPAFRDFVNLNGLQAFATDQDEVGAYHVRGGRIAALYRPTENFKLTLSYLTQTSETDGFPIQTSGYFEQTLIRVAPEHVRRGQNGGFNDFSLDIANAVIEYDFGWADLLGTYSYLKGDAVSSAPYGVQGLYATPWAASAIRDFPHRDDVGEIRLVSKLNGAWNFLVGVYADNQYNAQDLDITWHGDPAQNPYGQRNGVLTYLNQRDLRQQAAFAEVSWKFLPRFTLTGGVRHYQYDRVNHTDQGGPLLGNIFTSTREENEESGETFRANLSFKPNDDALVYAGWAQGFRLGQPLPPVPAGLCDVSPPDGVIDGTNTTLASTLSLRSDSVNSYEVGSKLALGGRRVTLEGALFRMDWQDIPVHQFLPCGWNHYFNAGSARSEGIELQTSIRLTEALRADIGGSYIKAELTEDVPAQGYHAGDRLPGAPKLNGAVGLQYEFNLLGRMAFVRGDAIYVGPFYNDVIQNPDGRAGDYVKVNATARVILDNFNIDVYVRNLTDEDAYTNRGQSGASSFNGYRMQPRTIGFQLGYNF